MPSCIRDGRKRRINNNLSFYRGDCIKHILIDFIKTGAGILIILASAAYPQHTAGYMYRICTYGPLETDTNSSGDPITCDKALRLLPFYLAVLLPGLSIGTFILVFGLQNRSILTFKKVKPKP